MSLSADCEIGSSDWNSKGSDNSDSKIRQSISHRIRGVTFSGLSVSNHGWSHGMDTPVKIEIVVRPEQRMLRNNILCTFPENTNQ